ncbi:MAG TPA: hypothetical protein PK199_08775 [Bacteroidales bacterium]|nr:hypothetical protein [Bacteroidales bacterium]
MKKLFYCVSIICLSHIAFSQEIGVMSQSQDYYKLEVVHIDSMYAIKNEHNTILYSQLDTAFYDKHASLFIIQKNKKWGAVSKYGQERLSCTYDTIKHLFNSYWGVCENKKWGVVVINTPVTIVIPIEYNSITTTMVVAKEFIVEKQGLFGVYSIEGKKVFDCEYTSIKQRYGALELRKNSITLYSVGNCNITDSIDFTRTLYMPGEYPEKGRRFYTTVGNNGYGLINSNVEQCLPMIYTSIKFKHRIVNSSGIVLTNSTYIFIQEQNIWGAYNIQTKEITPCTYASIEELAVALNLPEEKK